MTAAYDEVAWLSGDMAARVHASMVRRRSQDAANDHQGWRGVRDLTQGFGLAVSEGRNILAVLAAHGYIESCQFSNGLYHRAISRANSEASR